MSRDFGLPSSLVAAGSLTLSGARLNSLRCGLMELSATRCRAQVERALLESELGFKWKDVLRAGLPVQASVDIPPVLCLEGKGVLVRFTEFEVSVEVELAFEVDALQHKTIISREGYRVLLEHFSLQRMPGVRAEEVAREAPAPGSGVIASEAGFRGGKEVQASVHHFLQNKKIGEILMHLGYLSAPQVEEALLESKARRERLGRYLVRNHKITADAICHALALQSGLPVIDLSKLEISDALCALFPQAVLREYGCLPFDESRTTISLACSELPAPAALLVLERICRRKIQPYLASEELLALELDLLARKHKPRKFTRYKAGLPARFQFSNRLGAPIDTTFYECLTRNIGMGGLAVYGDAPIPAAITEVPRHEMYVQLALQDPRHEFHAICQLRWLSKETSKAEPSDGWTLGMQFVEVGAADQKHLHELCLEASRLQTREVPGEPQAPAAFLDAQQPALTGKTQKMEAPAAASSGLRMTTEHVRKKLRALGLMEEVLIHEQDYAQFFLEQGIQELGRGGEGAVYFLRGHVVKVAHAQAASAALREVAHMIYLNRTLKGGVMGERERPDWPALLWIYALSDGSLSIGMKPFDASAAEVGTTLAVRLQRGPQLERAQVFRILRALAQSLAYAHGRGIIHHDLKSANVYIPADQAQPPVIFDLGQSMWKNSSWGTDWLKHEHNAAYWYNGTFRYMHYRRRLAQLGAIATLHDRLPTPRQAQALELYQPSYFDDVFAYARIVRDIARSPQALLNASDRAKLILLYQNLMSSEGRDSTGFRGGKTTDKVRRTSGLFRPSAADSALLPVVGALQPKNPTMQHVAPKVEKALSS